MTGPLVPFREFVLKVHSRCDLACDHCYVYEHADQSWLTRPKVISDEAISWTARRLAEHATTHALPSVTVILHGGEPLLAGPARLRRVCEELGSALNGIAELDLRIHTNGVQLSPRYLDLFDEFHVRVGISLDGDRAANDRHRRYADGRSSHPMVLRAVELLREERYRHLDLGLLCTVDIHNDPVAVHDALAELEPPLVDFLLPHATWDEPPPRPDGSPTAYAAWLLTVFDRWTEQGRPMPVRMFASVLSSLSGGPGLTESLGLAPPPTSSSSRPTGRWNRSTRSRAPTKAPPPPGSTSSATPSTRSPPTPASGPGSSVWPASARPAAAARSYVRAAAGSTPTATAPTTPPAAASTTPPCTAPTWPP